MAGKNLELGQFATALSVDSNTVIIGKALTSTGTITANSFSGDGSGLTGVTSYVTSNFDSDFGDNTTDDLTEGSTNLYYTSTRFDDALAAKDTSSLSEGNNKYYTTSRADSDAKAAISVTDAGGDGSLTYSSGVITYTGPSASETRAHFSAGTGITLSSGQISIGQAVATTDSVTFSGLTVSGDLTVTGTTTQIDTIAYTVADPLLHLADSNETSDVVDIGFVGHYSDDGGSTKKHTGIFRDASDDKFKIFYGLVDAALDSSVPTNVIDTSGTGYTVATLVGNLEGDVTGDLTGDVTGDVTGNVTGNLTGNVTGNVTGDLTGDINADSADITTLTGGTINVTGTVKTSSVNQSQGILQMSANISANYTVDSGNNAFSAGPVSIDSGYAVTIPDGSVWTIV